MSNWHNYTLDQVGTIVSGSTPNTENPDFWNGNINWVTPNDLSKQKTRFIYNSDRKLSLSGFKSCNLIAAPALKSLIISSRAPVGYLAIPQIDSATNQGCKTIIFKENHCAEFYYYVLLYNVNKIKQRAEGTTFAEISKKELSKISFPAPDLLTQKRIAKILSTVDGQIEKTEAIITKYQAIKQGMLQDLFTRGIDLTTSKLRPTPEQAPELYKQSALGLIPKCWDVDMLENLTDKIGSGVTPTGGSEIYRKEGVLFLRSQNILINKLDISDVAYISNKIDESMFSSSVKRFDVLLNITGASIGRCAFFPENLDRANVNQHVCIIRFITHYLENSIFASEYINSPFIQNQISTLNAGGNREGLNYQQIKSFWFPILPQDEILKIVHIINQVNSKLRNEQNALNKLQKLKQGVMSKLLSIHNE